MDQLGPYALAPIARQLTRRQCVWWSWTCRHLQMALRDLCDLRLTPAQAEVVQQIVATDARRWAQLYAQQPAQPVQPPLLLMFAPYAPKPLPFPQRYTVASGPSTGKTLIALYAASKLTRAGTPTMLVAPLKLCHQWRAEHQKFAAQLGLAPLCVVHPAFAAPAEWRAALAAGALALVPSSVINLPLQANQHGDVLECLQALLALEWRVVLADEASRVPTNLLEYGRRAHAQGRSFHMISLNASRGGETLAAHAADAALGALPQVQVLLEADPFLVHSPVAAAAQTGARFAAEHLGQKTVIVGDELRVHTIGMIKPHALLADLRELGGRAAINITNLKGAERGAAIQQFAAATQGILVAPTHLLRRGYNLHCDSLVVLAPRRCPTPAALLQLLGRVRRVESPFARVRLAVLQPEVRPADLAFYALALGTSKSTSELLREAAWFHSALQHKGYAFVEQAGKRVKLDGHELRGDGSPQSRLQTLQRFYPDAARAVREYTALRLVVEST